MKFKLVIDKTQEETVVATVHERSRLTDEMEQLVLRHDGSDRIAASSPVDDRDQLDELLAHRAWHLDAVMAFLAIHVRTCVAHAVLHSIAGVGIVMHVRDVPAPVLVNRR